MRRIVPSLVCAVLCTGVVFAANAQNAPRRRGLVEVPSASLRGGFYFTGVLGAGREQCKFSDAPCAILDASGNPLPSSGTWRDPITSPAFALRLGGTPTPWLRLGGEFMGWSGDNGPYTEHSTALLLDGQFYPARRSGFYLKGGVGYSWDWTNFNDGTKSNTESGFAFNLGVGYDIPLSPYISLAPDLDFYQGSFPSAGQATLTDRVLLFGVAVTLQSNHHRW
jgi:Outer membrane protein beta-barrel domain